MSFYVTTINNNYLAHHGVKGMKWGVRRYQNKDGGLTYAGRKHLLKEEYKSAKKAADRQYTKAAETWDKTTNRGVISNKKADKALDDAADKWAVERKSAKQSYKQQKSEMKKAYKQSDEYKAKRKKAIKIGAAVAGTTLAAYGAYKVSQVVRDKNMSIAYEAGQKSVQRNINMMDKLFKDAVNNKEVQSYSYKINADNIVNSHLDRARNDSLKTAFKNVYKYERSGGNYSGYVPSGALEVAWKRKR